MRDNRGDVTGTVPGLVQDAPLLTSATLAHAAACFGRVEVATAERGTVVHRYDYATADARARRVASTLFGLGVGPGRVAAMLAWNGWRTFELMHAVPGSGAVLHTANPRLHVDQIAYAVAHAGARALFVDPDCLPIAEEIRARCPAVERWVLLADRDAMPRSSLPGLVAYEDQVAEGDESWRWPAFDERAAATLCFTSGTTGEPKGVLYSHRGTILNVMTIAGANGWGLGRADCVLATAPFFHCNGWGLPYMAPMVGARLVLPGRALDPAAMVGLIRAERVTATGGVPTIWFQVLDHLAAAGGDLAPLRRVWTGGTAPPESMIERLERIGVATIHAFGMTETTHALTVSLPDPEADAATRRRQQVGQGQPVFLSAVRAADEDGRPLPADGAAMGRLQVRGPAVAAGYFGRPDLSPVTPDGWLDTGDLGTVDGDGRMTILDRAKDAIKSGGEWISSVDLEAAALGCPGIAEAAAIGVFHPRWQERPLLLLVRSPGAAVGEAEVRAHLAGRVANWWLPDAIRFVEGLPRTATGKVLKQALRQTWADVLTAEAVADRGP